MKTLSIQGLERISSKKLSVRRRFSRFRPLQVSICERAWRYIDSVTPAIVDRDEYSEMMRNIATIVQDALDYVNAYVNHKNGTAPLHPREYARKYGFSTLPYFDDILGLT